MKPPGRAYVRGANAMAIAFAVELALIILGVPAFVPAGANMDVIGTFSSWVLLAFPVVLGMIPFLRAWGRALTYEEALKIVSDHQGNRESPRSSD